VAPISESDLPGIRHLCSVLRKIALNADLLSNFQGVLPPSEPSQHDWAAKLKVPVGNGASGIFYVKIKAGVRIGPLDLCDGSSELHQFCRVVFGREGMMRSHGFGRQKENQPDS